MDQSFLIALGLFLIIDLAVILYIFVFRKKKGFSEKDLQYFRDRFLRLEMLASQDPHFVILEADKLFDRALAVRGYQGSLADKMRHAENLFHDVQGIWRAHKLRNFIAHEVDSSVSSNDARTALRAFKRAFRDIGVSL